MKIKTADEKRLVIEYRSTAADIALYICIGFTLFGFIKNLISSGADTIILGFAALVFLVVYLLIKTYIIIIFDADLKKLFWRNKKLYKKEIKVIEFADIKKVKRESNFDQDGVKYYRVIIETTDGVFPLTDNFTHDDKKTAEIEKVLKDFLHL